ncbi:hypothetical protein AOCH_005803 [Aspergillus ochraceoroseus]|uniref:Zn(2)-C6 fungal-type domain-containing protein n=1 Tax=Aspergillus ochraceoroseus TaxID=138278 RepID=A0A0F8W9P4_9EURO|nr:hypothetical protein AOCH_005803 [Aspergillus ochraceoroseus]
MTKGCYTCRRRRIICDNALPTCRKCRGAGKECLGYQKPLVWVKGGVASRGKMIGLSFDDVQKDTETQDNLSTSANFPENAELLHPSSLPPPPQVETEAECADRHQGAPVAVNRVPIPWVLTDPLFKDCSRMSRFYIDHFNHNVTRYLALYSDVRNPFRDLIPLVSDSPVISYSLAATGALHHAILVNGEFSPMPWSADRLSTSGIPSPPEEAPPTEISSLVRRPSTRSYEHFLGLKQRALHQLSQDICDPVMRNDNMTLAAIMVFALMDAIESGHAAWKFHLEGAKKIIQNREHDPTSQARRMMNWVDDFATDGCLLIQLMGSTLARPGSLSKPFYSSAMGLPVLKRLEETSWVGCPAYLLEAILLVHAFFDLEPDANSSPHVPEGSNPLQCPDKITLHIQAFDPVAWAESLQSYLYLPDLSMRIALATIYKASVYLYATRVLSRPRPGSTISTTLGLPPDHAEVAALLIHQISLIPVSDPHFKCLIWPSFIAGAECRDPAQRPFLLESLRTLYFLITSVNIRNAAWVLTLMWRKRDLRRGGGSKFPVDPPDRDISGPDNATASCFSTASTATRLSLHNDNFNDDDNNDDDDDDDDDFDWIQELDDSQVDWLFI